MNTPEFYNLLKNFIFEICPIAKKALADRIYFPPAYDKYPKLKFRENGMPDIDFYGEKPLDISRVFHAYAGKADVELDEYATYIQCVEYLSNTSDFDKIIYFFKKDDDKWNKTCIRIFLIHILERYYLLNKTEDNNDELLEQIYTRIENAIFNEILYFDFSIPVLFVNFDFDEYKINDFCTLRRISDDYHKARIFVTSYSPPVTPTLISCATHELVLKRWYVKNERGPLKLNTDYEQFYPLDKFDNLIVAIKTATNINTGYAQLLIYPDDWSAYDRMDLPGISGMSIKRYPSYFENYYWNEKELPCVSLEQAAVIGKIYERLDDCNNKLKIACKRLRYSCLREDEEDSILDIIIAMEVLLTDNERGEITHKLSLRLSKLIALFRTDYNPFDAFSNMKRIYAYRSKIVHGGRVKSKSKEIKMEEKSVAGSDEVKIANDYLRLLIQILLEHPKFLDVKEIDKAMITS